jgi:glycine/D-amino acid oxidase-like deaminating enzyme
MRVSVLGGGVAGALLAWRLAQQPGIDQVWIAPGAARERDATAASGGLVRGYETEPEQRRLAVDSLLELLGDQQLQDWAGFTLAGSVYRPLDPAELPKVAAEIEAEVPDSVELLTATDLRGRGWNLPAAELAAGSPSAGDSGSGPIAIGERQAGYVNPARLRGCVLADLAGRGNVTLLPDGAVSAVAPGRFELNGAAHQCDVVVLATGAWTPSLLRACGWDAGDLRTKAIQYTVYRTTGWLPQAFVDEPSGLYGKPTSDGGLLLGVPTEAWNVSPDAPGIDPALSRRAQELALSRFPQLRLAGAAEPTSAADCYCTAARLALRPVPGAENGLFTYTGGSGGAAKTALAASRQAAIQLADGHRPDLKHHHP